MTSVARGSREAWLHRCWSSTPPPSRLAAAPFPPRITAGRRAIERHQRHDEATERLANDDKISAIADRTDDGVDVVGPARRVVIYWEFGRHDIVAVLGQQRRNEVPVPGAVARPVDQDVSGHDWYKPSVLLSQSPIHGLCVLLVGQRAGVAQRLQLADLIGHRR